MKYKNKLTIKVLVLFFTIMLLLTFFSHSILYFFSPKITVEKPNYTTVMAEACVIPIYALINDNTVYVLDVKKGLFRDELIVRQKNVQLEAVEGGMAVVTGELNLSDTLVTGWDRALRDGQRVFLPLK